MQDDFIFLVKVRIDSKAKIVYDKITQGIGISSPVS